MKYDYKGENGKFELKGAGNWSYLYFPVGSDNGTMGVVTPEFGGDLKGSQNTFLLEPVSSDNLHNNKSTRNFWIRMEDGKFYSATGASAIDHWKRLTEGDDSVLTADQLSQTVTRKVGDEGLKAEVTVFAPSNTEDKIELMKVTISNEGDADKKFTPVVAVPIYGRSADNIRDHRNVTSMLGRAYVSEYGITDNPTLTFDERGHRRNIALYGVYACDEEGKAPEKFCPIMEDFIGEGGALDAPEFVKTLEPASKAGTFANGFELMGAASFEAKALKAGESATYYVGLIIDEMAAPSNTDDEIIANATKLQDKALKHMAGSFEKELEAMREYWALKNNVKFKSGNTDFDNWMYWVSLQPMLRRIYGCSFLPHHDYGKGGRGWRDLWQDCLALIMMDPQDVRGMLVNNFGGVRTDGTNATIIGTKPGEFIADRNGITRVWMDHAMWPFMTCELYLKNSGDFDFLLEKAPYFIDRQVRRGEKLLDKMPEGASSEGTVIEHLLLQNLAAFYDIGEHGHMKLRGADWNDALDMAADKGESVAFTAAYCGNYRALAQILLDMKKITGTSTVEVAKEIEFLLGKECSKSVLDEYCSKVETGFDGQKVSLDIDRIAEDLKAKADYIAEHILGTEWYVDSKGFGRFNGYYDNSGRAVEKADGKMMLTGEVFTVMSGVATDEQVKEICKSADEYLYSPELGGYRLNTDFHEIKTDMGRMFGFAYGQKENGAVFSHMTVMYGNALYRRGFINEGYKVINTLYSHAADFENSKIFPGIPEYFDPKGRGVYHYLTGAASWLLLTVLGEVFGVKGDYGKLKFEPKLLMEQFNDAGEAGVKFVFGGKTINLTYVAKDIAKDYKGKMIPSKVVVNGTSFESDTIDPSAIEDNADIVVVLEAVNG